MVDLGPCPGLTDAIAAYAGSANFMCHWPHVQRELKKNRRCILPSGVDCYDLMRYLRYVLTTLALTAPSEKQQWRLYASVYKLFSLSIDAWPFGKESDWGFRIFTGGWTYHDLQLLFVRYTAWYALFCPRETATESIRVLSHHRMIHRRHLKHVPCLARLGPNEQLRAIAEMAYEEALERIEEEGLLGDPFD